MVPGFPVILASASPRRRELLKQIFPDFQVRAPNLDESSDEYPLEQRAANLAIRKANCFSGEGSLVIGSDTIVVLNDQALGKPEDEVDAKAMLSKLSAATHQVMTGVAFTWPGGSHSFCEVASVAIRELSISEIDAYVESGEPMDKAGAYAIQGCAAAFATVTQGHVETVIGLPTSALAQALREHGVAR